MVVVNTGSAAALELALLDVPQLTSYARRVIVQQRPFATFADSVDPGSGLTPLLPITTSTNDAHMTCAEIT